MRILRVIGSRTLPCGCLIGRYETYGGQCVELVDHLGARCPLPQHRKQSLMLAGMLPQWVRQVTQALSGRHLRS